MKKRKNSAAIFAGLCLCTAAFCLSVCASAIRLAEKAAFERTARIIAELETPDLQERAILALKRSDNEKLTEGAAILARYGYGGRGDEFLSRKERGAFAWQTVLFAALPAGGVLCLFLIQKRNKNQRIAELTDYLACINTGSYSVKPTSGEDAFSGLEDELYKTVVLLREGREKAQQERENLAQNLADISHQLKTPLASVSLLSELLANKLEGGKEQRYMKQILTQIDRMNELVAALLTLSRLDAGTLVLEAHEVNVRELLSCAAEPLFPQMTTKEQRLCVSGDAEISLPLDFRWTMEALSNLIKNCSEHTPVGGAISIRYGQNPIYTQITIEDEGAGFDADELPHLFERFYRGKNASDESVGIGLSLAQSLIRRQNGELRAENRTEGGARFIMKLYRTVSPD